VRLRDRRRRLGRLRAGQPAERGPRRRGAARRGRRLRRQRPDRHPGRLLGAVSNGERLGSRHRPGAARQRPAHLPPPRQDPRRQLVAQRDDLHARQPGRLRRLGRRLELRRAAPVLQALRGERARRERVPRRRRAAAGVRRARSLGALPGVRRQRGRGRPSRQRRLQRRRAGRRRLVPADPARRQARLLRAVLPAPGLGPAEPHGREARARAARAHGGHPRHRHRRRAPRRGPRVPGLARGHPLCRRLRLAAAVDALGHRSPRGARAAADRAAGRIAGRGPQPPGPPQRRGDPRRRGADKPVRGAEPRQPRPADGRGPGTADLERGRGRRVHPHPRRTRGPRRPVPLRPGGLPARGPDPRPGARLRRRGLRAQAPEPRLRGTGLARPDGQAADRPQLPRPSRRSRLDDRRGPRLHGDRRHRAARPLRQRADQRAGLRLRRRHPRSRRGQPPDALPPGRHVPDGDRRSRGRRPRAARAWGGGTAGHRRLGHADGHARQHQRADDRHRRAGGGPGPRTGARARRRDRGRV
ncbi:MAG: Oxidoreductase, GMC family, partial [uncultured Solirubrobacterales bacterium]